MFSTDKIFDANITCTYIGRLASTADRTFKTNEGSSSYKHMSVLSVFVYEVQPVFIFCYLITFTEDDENDISR